MHGPVAVLGPDHGLLAFAPPGPAAHGVLEAVDEARRRGAPALVAAPGADLDLVPMPEWLSPLGAVIPAQRLAAATQNSEASTSTARSAFTRSQERPEPGVH